MIWLQNFETFAVTPLLNFLNVSVCLSVSVSLSQRDEIRLTDGNRAADGSTPRVSRSVYSVKLFT